MKSLNEKLAAVKSAGNCNFKAIILHCFRLETNDNMNYKKLDFSRQYRSKGTIWLKDHEYQYDFEMRLICLRKELAVDEETNGLEGLH